MAMSRELKVGIAGGVISSLVVIYLFQPIVDGSIYLIKGLAHLTGQAYYDRIFVQAAILEERNFGFFFIAGIMFIASYLFAYGSYKSMSKAFGGATKEKPEQPLNFKRTISVIMAIFSFAFLIFTGVVISANHLQLELITSFKQYMRIIRPHIDPSQEVTLISRWSQMKGRKDYLLIMAEINQIAENNKIILPKNTLYAIDTL